MKSPSSPRLSLVAALARNRVIGRDNTLPWRLSGDLRRFKALTLGHPVIMGRKTWDSIIARNGKALPGRLNIVISRSSPAALTRTTPAPGDVRFVQTMEKALEEASRAAGSDEVFVIGGEQIYALTLPDADRLYLTEVLAYVEGDAWFPPYDAAQWKEVSREHGNPAEQPPHDFVVLDRR